MTSRAFPQWLYLHAQDFQMQNGIPETDKTSEKKSWIHSLIASIGFHVYELIASGGEIIHSVQHKRQWEELNENDVAHIKDLHGTLGLFMKSFDYACEMERQWKTNISIQAYIYDIAQLNISDIQEKIHSQWINPSNIIIEILDDDYGVFNGQARSNIERLHSMGFEIAVHDFIEEGNMIDTRYLQSIDTGIIPKFIHVSKKVLHGIKAGFLHFTDAALWIFHRLQNAWVGFISSDKKTGTGLWMWNRAYPEILNLAEITEEFIIDIDGNIQWSEGLVRFQNGISVSDGLKKLKQEGQTIYLLEKGIKASLTDCINEKRRTVNAYLKDLEHPWFREMILKNTHTLSKSERKYLIFEINEERYGNMNRRVLENIKWLQTLGFWIAIDDLFVSRDNSSGISLEILESLIEEGIPIDYIKIDGRHIEAIRKWEIKEYEMNHLRQLIGQQLTGQQKFFPVYIIEWVQDKEHAQKLLNIFGREHMKIWFQGKYIQLDEFRNK